MTTYKRGDHITLKEAAKLYAGRDFRENDDARTANHRARSAIRYALKKGGLPSPDGGKTFKIELLIGWMRSIVINGDSWDDKFKGFPADVGMKFECVVPLPTCEVSIVAQSNSLDVANRKWAALQAEHEAMKAALELAQAKAARYDDICETNQESAKLKRGVDNSN